MDALTIQQPWAEQIMTGERKIEYRSWGITDDYVLMRIYIHAGKKSKNVPKEDRHKFQFGGIVGKVTVVRCRDTGSECEWDLEKPARVIQSRSDPQAELFYHLLPEPRLGIEWLCVVVKYRPKDAFLLTAYLTDRPKEGTQLWPAK